MPLVTADLESDVLELAFALHRNPGAHVLVLGAGVSLAAGMPSADEVQNALIAEIAAGAAETPDDPAAWWTARTGRAPRYDELLARLARTPLERQAALRSFFEPDEAARDRGDRVPGPAHRAVARLVAAGAVRIVVTLNFDTLIETALIESGVRPVVASTAADLAAIAPLHSQRALVVHLHGDYLDASSMRNTPAELEAYEPATTALLERIADEYGLIVAGWSARWDPALRRALARPTAHWTTWWLEPGDLAPEAGRLLAMRRGRQLRVDAGAALGRAADAVAAMGDGAARHPRTVQVAVASAKRALQGGHRAIGLHDELRAEFARVEDSPYPAVPARPSRAQIEALEERGAARLGVLAPLVAATAYWGDASTDEWWVGDLERLATIGHAEAAFSPPRHAAALLLHAATAAGAAAGRLGLVHRLLVDTTVRDPRGFLSAAEALAPDRVLRASGGARRIAGFVVPLLREHLALSGRAAIDAWERAHHLQLVERVHARTDDGDLMRLAPLVDAAWHAHPWGPQSNAGRSAAERRLKAALDGRVQIDVGEAFLARGGFGGLLMPAVSAPLRRELTLRGRSHPLLSAGFCGGDLDRLQTVISIVDHAIAAESDQPTGRSFRGSSRSGMLRTPVAPPRGVGQSGVPSQP